MAEQPPKATDHQCASWPHEELNDDFHNAVCLADGGAYPRYDRITSRTGIGTAALPPLEPADIEQVARWYVSYFDFGQWKPGMRTYLAGLNLYAVLKLRSGHWASVVAWNDTTGWDCENSSIVRIGSTEADVVANGLDAAGRRLLGYENAQVQP
jgi:hypothetical protein